MSEKCTGARRLLALVTIAVAGLALAACGSSDSSSTDTTGSSGGGDQFSSSGLQDAGDAEVEVGVTPFRGAGTSTGDDYFQTTRYKGFEAAVREETAAAGVKLVEIQRSRGVWDGGGEPSVKLRLKGDPLDVRKVMDALGHRFNQDAVV
ncbi:MAG: hypothetical protein EXQ70_10680 [Solirubrobacterales bacterium]|nr:hypothetical protein [Solirubrobacterales bacterium]